MGLRTTLLITFGIAMSSCGVNQQQGAKRTLAGLSGEHVLISAQHALAKEGLDVEEIDLENGELTSEWKERHRKQVQYTVAVTPKEGGADGDSQGIVVIEVSAVEKEKIVGGWSKPIPVSTSETDDLLDEIVDMSIGRYIPGEIVESEPKCGSSSDCPGQTHCGSGRCVSECAQNSDCEPGRRCDDKGRCIPPEPEPCPEMTDTTPTEEKESKKDRRRDQP